MLGCPLGQLMGAWDRLVPGGQGTERDRRSPLASEKWLTYGGEAVLMDGCLTVVLELRANWQWIASMKINGESVAPHPSCRKASDGIPFREQRT